MTRHVLTTGLAAAVLWTAAAAAETPAKKADVPPPPDADRLDQIHKQLREIRDELNAQRVVREEERKNLDMELRLLRERLNAVERSVETLRSTRVAGSFTPSPAPQSGTLRLQNRSAVPATVFVSGRAYPLQPQETVTLAAQPAGTFTYEVLAEGFGTIREPQTRTLVAGETFTITINP